MALLNCCFSVASAPVDKFVAKIFSAMMSKELVPAKL